MVFLETPLHQMLVLGQSLVPSALSTMASETLALVLTVMPRFYLKVQIGVENILAERRIGEDVVDGTCLEGPSFVALSPGS